MGFVINISVNNVSKYFSIDELLFDGKHFFINKEQLGISKDLILPLVKADDKWTIRSLNYIEMIDDEGLVDTITSARIKRDDLLEKDAVSIAVRRNGALIIDKVLEHNDFFFISNNTDDVKFVLYVRETSKLSLNGGLYRTAAKIVVGRDASCDICYSACEAVSRKQFVLFIDESGNFRVESLKERPNFYINGKLSSSATLEYGDELSAYGLTIIYLGQCLSIFGEFKTSTLTPIIVDKDDYITGVIFNGEDTTEEFDRTPRIMSKYEKTEYPIDLPPQPLGSKKMPVLLTVGPSLTMSLAMMVTVGVSVSNYMNNGQLSSIITSGALALSMLLGAILWPILTRRYQNRQEKQEANKRYNMYSEYIDEQKSILKQKNERNKVALEQEFFPSPKRIMEVFERDSKKARRLYEKTTFDEDYLSVRIGTSDVLSDIVVNVPQKGFSTNDDRLKNMPYELQKEFKYVSSAPASISFRNNKISGLIGDRKLTDKVFKTLLMSLTFGHSYDEVKTVFVYKSSDEYKYSWCKSLYHTQDEASGLRYVATTREEVHRLFNHFTEILDLRTDSGALSTDKGIQLPYYIFFILDRDLIEDETLVTRITKTDKETGFSLFYLADDVKELPKECRMIIKTDNTECVYYNRSHNNNVTTKLLIDEINDDLFAKYLNKLKHYKLKSSEYGNLSVPEKISFLGMYKVGNVAQLNIKQRWEGNSTYDSISAPIGMISRENVLSLNLHETYHGPHGLVAGMTGSGKSEFLQTLILSLAINYNPDDLRFILIDFKGGGMANVFDGLPHLAGKITNLSGAELARSLLSIDAELRRRQKLLNDANVTHIDKYQKLYKAGKGPTVAMPHLVIIVDEFAQLKSQQPEFMKKLIDVAQIGRSLGVHLLLATQKPAGIVDDQIWGNSRFRVCLKVLEKQDSNEMIRRPDAAMIKLPGRSYLQVGYDEIFAYFQSGFSGAPYLPADEYVDENDKLVALTDSCGYLQRSAALKMAVQDKENTQLKAVVSYISELGAKLKFFQKLLWLNSLPATYVTNEFTSGEAKAFDGKKWQHNDGLRAVIGLADYPEEQQQIAVDLDLNKGNYAIYGMAGSGKTSILQTFIYGMCNKYSPDEVKFSIFDFGGRTLGSFVEMPHVSEVLFADDEMRIKDTVINLLKELEDRKKLFGAKGVSSLDGYNALAKEKLPALVIVIDNYSVVMERFSNQMSDAVIRLVREGNSYGITLIVTGSSKSAVYYRVSDYIVNNITLRLPDKAAYRDIFKQTIDSEPEDVKGRGMILYGKKALEFQTALISAKSDAERGNQVREKSYEMKKACGEKTCKAVKAEEKAVVKQAYVNDGKSFSIGRNKDGEVVNVNFNEFRTLIVMGKNRSANLVVLNDIKNRLALLDKTVMYTFDLKNEISGGGKHYASQIDGKISSLITELKNAADGSKKVFVIIPNFQAFYEYTTQADANILEELAASAKNMKLYFIVEDTPQRIYNMTGCAFFCLLKKDKTYKGIYVGNGILEQYMFDCKSIKYEDGARALPENAGYAYSGDVLTAIEFGD